MSSGKEWLGKMKKGELSEMADHLKLGEYVFTQVPSLIPRRTLLKQCDHSYAKAKKNELELMIEDFLNTNKSNLAKDTLVAPFYGNLEPGSPEPEKKKPRRRQTMKAIESESL